MYSEEEMFIGIWCLIILALALDRLLLEIATHNLKKTKTDTYPTDAPIEPIHLDQLRKYSKRFKPISESVNKPFQSLKSLKDISQFQNIKLKRKGKKKKYMGLVLLNDK